MVTEIDLIRYIDKQGMIRQPELIQKALSNSFRQAIGIGPAATRTTFNWNTGYPDRDCEHVPEEI
jgi:hypothetical protein